MGGCRDVCSHLLLVSWLLRNGKLGGRLRKRCFSWKHFFDLFDYLWLLHWCLRLRDLCRDWCRYRCLFLLYRLNRNFILNYRCRCLGRSLIFNHWWSSNLLLLYRGWRWLLCSQRSNRALVGCFGGASITLLLL